KPEPNCSVDVDKVLLRRAAQLLGTCAPQETVATALRDVVAVRQQATELARPREHLGRISAITGQALQKPDSTLT
ncbi:hypothetical protein QIT00_34905, partial [Streptomyces sp. B-S-A12]|nr:hypothetical protein [Streptomyces sp. B-S-A12]